MTTPAKDRPVVVGVDGSDEGMAAVHWAADEARGRQCPLWVVHAVDLEGITILAGFYSDAVDAARRAAQDVLDRAVAKASDQAGDVQVRPILEDGHPSNVLLRHAPHAQLLVLGARGRGGFASMMLGSTSLQVAMHAHCPVLVLRSGVAGLADGPSAGRIVVGTDGSPLSEHAVALAFEEAELSGAGLTALRTWLAPDIDVDALPPHEWEQAEKDEQARLTESLAVWRSRFPGVDVIEKALRGDPAATLVEESAGAQLLTVGSHGRGGFGGMVLGSVSHAVLHHAHCPVAVTRP